ncbi:hypothetical protein [Cerasicoccus frondis]|uniref:hypothetical protein n=1 Tax=Cerasicoccus frondis TaxID=490090 RepID=UPI0028527FB6|nr:hypothetical protein [Cerasicoccus frondis]
MRVQEGEPSPFHRNYFQDFDAITQLRQSGPWLIYQGEIPRQGLGMAEILQSNAVYEHLGIVNALNLDGDPASGF